MFARTPLELTRELAQKYDICFHVISSAPGEVEKRMTQSVASINECSRVLALDDLERRPEYMSGSLFVMDQRVFKVTKTQQKVVGFNMNSVLFDFNSDEISRQCTMELWLKLIPNNYL